MRPKREGRSKGSRAMATRSEAGTTDRLEVSCTPLSMRKVADVATTLRRVDSRELSFPLFELDTFEYPDEPGHEAPFQYKR